MNTSLPIKMEFFSQMISCGYPLSYWELDPSLQLIRSSCPEENLYYAYLLADHCRGFIEEHIRTVKNHPLLITGTLGLSWIASLEIVEGMVCRIHLIGPAFTSDISYLSLEKELIQKAYSKAVLQQFAQHIREIPIITLDAWLRYGLMLHFCVTGQRQEVSDYCYSGAPAHSDTLDQGVPSPSGGTWYAEQMAMKMVEEGQIDYKRAVSNLSSSGSSATLFGNTSLRQCKNYMISSITLVTRAAIRGGLDAQTAYHVGEVYLRNVEDSTSISDLARLNSTVYEDFIQRVHKVRTASGISPSIHSCCNYIDMHLSEKLSLHELALQAGYAENYLAQKFKREVGITIAQYIRRKRVAQGKLLLKTSKQSIASIADSLGFCNSSHFSDSFRSLTGMTPVEYREKGM